jgi:hypothetical protein
LRGATAPCYSGFTNEERDQMTNYKELPKENLRNLLRALQTQNKRQPTRETMTKIQAVRAALRGK